MAFQNVILTDSSRELIPYTDKAKKIGELEDVDLSGLQLTGSTDENQVLKYDYDSSKWVPGKISKEATSIDDTGLVNTTILKEQLALKSDSTHTHNLNDLASNGKLDVDNLTNEISGNRIDVNLLPQGFVDDIIEVKTYSDLPVPPESGKEKKIYVTTDNNKTYRWSGSRYVEISESLALGETSSSAFRGDRGKEAWEHATDSDAAKNLDSNVYVIGTTDKGHISSTKTRLATKSDITPLVYRFRETGYDGDGLVKVPTTNDGIHYLNDQGNFIIPKIEEMSNVVITLPVENQDILSFRDSTSTWVNQRSPIIYDTNYDLNVPDTYNPIIKDSTGTDIATSLDNINTAIKNLWTRTHLAVNITGTGNAITNLTTDGNSLITGEKNVTFFNDGGDLDDISKAVKGQSYKWTGTSTITVGSEEIATGEKFIYVDSNKVIKFGGDAKWGKITGSLSNQTDLQNKLDYLEAMTVSGYTYKGTATTPSDLPTTGNKVGDTIYVSSTNSNYVWNGTSWDNQGYIINLSDYYTKSQTYNKTEIDNKMVSAYTYKGSVDSTGSLPMTGNKVGDMIYVESNNHNYVWNGTSWDDQGNNIDLSNYYNKTETDDKLSLKADTTFVSTELNNKQNKNTAVTHTASTAVGSSSQPVYVNTSGVATAVTMKDTANALINSLSTGQEGLNPTDNYYYIAQGQGGDDQFVKRKYSSLAEYIKGKFSTTTTGSGNAITALSYSNGVITGTKGSTFLTSHQTVTNSNPTLAWGTKSTVGTIGSTALTVTMPSNPNTDTKVTQTVTTTNANYPVLLKNTNAVTTVTDTSRFASAITINPSTGNLAVKQINGVTVGSSPKFTDTNTKVTMTATNPTSQTTYYPISSSSGSTNTGTTVFNDGFKYITLQGTASAQGTAILQLGNSTASGTAGNKTGHLTIYGEKANCNLLYAHTNLTANMTNYLPKSSGTLVCHTTDTAIGSSTVPVYVNANGVATKCTGYSLPSIELTPSTSSTNGGFIDFHYAGSIADYTSRIIESASGTLSLNSVKISGSTITGSLSGNATSATTATKLGSSTVGGTAKPIYLSSGTATACSSTVGGTAKPVYMSSGTITACSSTVGSTSQPVYMSSGTISACTVKKVTVTFTDSSTGTYYMMG